jgi:hypothetical protein
MLASVSFATTASAATGFLDVGGSKVHYEATGTGPAILFVHDGHMDSESWNAQWEFFSKDHRVIRYEHPEGEHAFDIRHDDDTSREIVRRTLKFVEKQLMR